MFCQRSTPHASVHACVCQQLRRLGHIRVCPRVAGFSYTFYRINKSFFMALGSSGSLRPLLPGPIALKSRRGAVSSTAYNQTGIGIVLMPILSRVRRSRPYHKLRRSVQRRCACASLPSFLERGTHPAAFHTCADVPRSGDCCSGPDGAGAGRRRASPRAGAGAEVRPIQATGPGAFSSSSGLLGLHKAPYHKLHRSAHVARGPRPIPG